jgi:hypothetical protein
MYPIYGKQLNNVRSKTTVTVPKSNVPDTVLYCNCENCCFHPEFTNFLEKNAKRKFQLKKIGRQNHIVTIISITYQMEEVRSGWACKVRSL